MFDESRRLTLVEEAIVLIAGRHVELISFSLLATLHK
jgi:hypothetical protein